MQRAKAYTLEVATAQDREGIRGIGGSDVPAIVGVDPFKTAQQVWERKMGLGERDAELSLDARRGHEQEDWAVREFVRATGLKVRRINGMFRAAPPWDHAVAHLDRQIVNVKRLPVAALEELGAVVPPLEQLVGPGALEVKNPRAAKWDRWRRDGIGQDAIAQGFHYLGVTGWQWGCFAIFHSERGLLPVFFVRAGNEALIQDLMKRTRAWWDTHIIGETAPPEPDPMQGLPELDGEVEKVEDPLWADLVEAWRVAREDLATSKEAEGEVQKLVKAYLEKRKLQAAVGGGAVVYYRPQKGRRSFNHVALKGYGALDQLKVQEILQNLTPAEATPAALEQMLSICQRDDGLGQEARQEIGQALRDSLRIIRSLLPNGQLTEWLKNARLDLDSPDFWNTSKPSRPLRPYFRAEK